ncbi:MAG: four helix bundle protein [Candidatus Marinimicrobia bacterium CG_4_10_14_0_2_um_filter_48_9]|nr:MAG: four helix bundle protein [Candidatus Marinimicrobia bacterium CG_4_10_14_0_2_um_filter_48_9]
MSENTVQKKSFHFALEVIKLYQYLTSTKKEYVLSKQVLRSGTSIGANIHPVKLISYAILLHICST